MIDLKEVVAKHTVKDEANIEELDKLIVKLKKTQVFGCEADVREEMQAYAQKVWQKRQAVTDKLPYPRIDLSFLGWMKTKGWLRKQTYPVFGAFPLKDPRFALNTYSSGTIRHVNVNGMSNTDLLEHYAPVFKHLREYNTYVWRFKGAFTPEARRKTTEAVPIFTEDHIYVIQELMDGPVIERDPLVVGIKNGVAYLITMFDLTTVEKYIASEFSHG